MNYTVLGTGRWGTAFAHLIAQKDDVFLWGDDESLVNRIQFDRKNNLFYPNVELPYEIRASYDLEHVVQECDILVFAISAFKYQDVLDEILEYLPDVEASIILPTGFDPQSGRRLSQEYLERMETLDNFYAISGPLLPRELIDQQPCSAVLAGQSNHNRDRIRSSLYRSYFKLFGSDDLIGTETFSSLKTLIGFITGLADGLGFPEGTRSSLIVRGLHEAKKLLEFEGGEPETLMKLEGLGGILVESTSETSPNYWFGRQLGRGDSIEKAKRESNGRLGCINNAQAVHQRILKGEIKAALFSETFRVIHGDLEPFEAVDRILNLDEPPDS